MSVRRVITVGDPRLRRRSKKIEKITPALQRLIDDMIETMHAENGVGLAAVQVGELLNVILVEDPDDVDEEGHPRLYVVINAEILRHNAETEAGIEGCLSVPGYVGEVERYTQVLVRGLDRRGKRLRIEARDFLARVFQHEIDHTQGILYIDRLTAPDRIWPVEEGEEEATEASQRHQTAAAPS